MLFFRQQQQQQVSCRSICWQVASSSWQVAIWSSCQQVASSTANTGSVYVAVLKSLVLFSAMSLKDSCSILPVMSNYAAAAAGHFGHSSPHSTSRSATLSGFSDHEGGGGIIAIIANTFYGGIIWGWVCQMDTMMGGKIIINVSCPTIRIWDIQNHPKG